MEEKYVINAPKSTDATHQSVQEWESSYSDLISMHLPYFNRLSPELRKKFLEHTHKFRHQKKFHYIGMDEKPEIPILISAAATQLTLGLQNHELPFFKNIYVTKDAYSNDKSEEAYIGHVAPDGIYLSWKYFLQGFSDPTDNVNVGIHELAHALAHEHFMGKNIIDKDFTTDFEKYCGAYGPEMVNWLISRHSYLRPYAFESFQEFWAVSVEAFFENPAQLKQYLPGLYDALSRVLNQDPLTPNILLPES